MNPQENSLEDKNTISADESSSKDLSNDELSLEDAIKEEVSSEVPSIDEPTKTKEESKLSAYNCYVDSVSTYYISGRYVYLGWSDYFDGYFKVYKGNKCVHSEYLYGYNKDLQWSTDNLDAGTYTAKLISYSGYTQASGKIVIAKATTKISCKSFTTTVGTKFYCYAYVKDKNDGANIDGGYVKFKINGKNYKAKLNDGVAVLAFTVPKKAKTYTCKASYAGGSNIKGCSVTFKMTVKNKAKVKYKTLTVSTKWNKYVTKKWKKYKAQTYKFKSCSISTVCAFLYKNGKMVSGYNYLSRVHYKLHGKWHWTKWRSSYGEAAYHKYTPSKKAVIGAVQYKFRI